jgi:hypothetical protein
MPESKKDPDFPLDPDFPDARPGDDECAQDLSLEGPNRFRASPEELLADHR